MRGSSGPSFEAGREVKVNLSSHQDLADLEVAPRASRARGELKAKKPQAIPVLCTGVHRFALAYA
jgi:hypothetical protein